MLLNNLGYPRIGDRRQLKKACEAYWAGKISQESLLQTGRDIRRKNWELQRQAGIDLIPSNDFSYYDQVLDMVLMTGAIPERYNALLKNPAVSFTDLYFALARGYQQGDTDLTAMEMTKWFDTNYHYLVPEFVKDQVFAPGSFKAVEEFREAGIAGIHTKPVLIGPVSFLLLGKEKEPGFHRLDLLEKLLPVYFDLLERLEQEGVTWVQLDEPFLALDLSYREKEAYRIAYHAIRNRFPALKIMLATYFEGLEENVLLAVNLPVCALHIDLVRAPGQLDEVLKYIPENTSLSLGIVDGRNIWKNDYERSLEWLGKAVGVLGEERIMIAPSCSLLHVPADLSLEKTSDPEILDWLAFARQKLTELRELSAVYKGERAFLEVNRQSISSRRYSSRIHDQQVKKRIEEIRPGEDHRHTSFPLRQQIQQERFRLPLFPTTTIGSFPQTEEIRRLRTDLKSGLLTEEAYEKAIEKATGELIRWQEEVGLDVLVHGEYERNDMVEYFGEKLKGFFFTSNGWVQSYGSRCVKPPVIFGDVSRPADMTVKWSVFAQAQTKGIVKGMLTGPVTILQWSFVRDDQPREHTAIQIALAIRAEVAALEKAGISMIQIDEPAIREGLPLRAAGKEAYLEWAVRAFRLSASVVSDATQIHTHMCYSDFNDIIKHIAAMDADVITIETSRSQMELLEAFSDFSYPNEIGPGVYDIHSPRVPAVDEMSDLLVKASALLPVRNLWVNPDCGLKTRKWPETEAALRNMVSAAAKARSLVEIPQ